MVVYHSLCEGGEYGVQGFIIVYRQAVHAHLSEHREQSIHFVVRYARLSGHDRSQNEVGIGCPCMERMATPYAEPEHELPDILCAELRLISVERD